MAREAPTITIEQELRVGDVCTVRARASRGASSVVSTFVYDASDAGPLGQRVAVLEAAKDPSAALWRVRLTRVRATLAERARAKAAYVAQQALEGQG
jgi:hypothetical protein